MESSDQKFFYEINIARGVCTLLVVAGHIVTQAQTNILIIDNIFNAIGIIIYSFHMHVFFFISGFLGSKTLSFTKIEQKEFLKSRFNRLLVPYFSMGILYLPLKIALSEYSRTSYSIIDSWKILIGENPDAALWFLYTLFVISFLVCIFVRRDNLNHIIIISFVFYLFSFFSDIDLNVIKTLLVYPLFFLLGINARLNYDMFSNMLYKRRTIIIASICMTFASILVLFYKISICSPFMTISGIIMVLYISKWISTHRGKIFNMFSLIAKFSMDIYIFSEPIKVVCRTVLKFMNASLVVSPLIIFLCALFLPIVFSKLFIRKHKLTRLLFLGMN